jgi:DNA ligase-1
MTLEDQLNNKGSAKDFLMLAQQYNKKQNVGGWFCSTKLDGMRAFWDGGITIGKAVNQIPWADVGPMDSRPCTGLWSRLRKPIMCPAWWSAGLPRIPLDGELWMGNGTFQQLMSVCRRQIPDDRWKKVQYLVFDSPHPMNVGLPLTGWDHIVRMRGFEETQDLLQAKLPKGMVVNQVLLPRTNIEAFLEHLLTKVVEEGGEGLMLRNPTSMWVGKRSKNLLKYKPFSDDEGIIDGYIWGEGKYEGMLGALKVTWGVAQFELSGMTDEERRLLPLKDGAAIGKPRTDVNQNEWFSPHFGVHSPVTFRYRCLSDGGVPKEARYKRKFVEEV